MGKNRIDRRFYSRFQTAIDNALWVDDYDLITPEAKLIHLGNASQDTFLAMTEIQMALEREFSIDLDDELDGIDVKFGTVGDVLEVIARKMNGG